MSGSPNNPWSGIFAKDPDFAYDDKIKRLLTEIERRKNQTPSPPPAPPPQPDPFVYASQVATMQPKDRAWRLFEGVLFRIADVRGIFPKGNLTITVRLTDGINHEFELPVFTKDNPTMWFSQHVLGMEFEFTPKQ